MDGGGRARATEDNKPQSQSLPTGANPKLVATRQPLLDLSNIVAQDPNPAISDKNYALLTKEITQLTKNFADKSKLTEEYEQELQKLKAALQGTRKENWQLAQTNSQMLAELNQGKDRLKNLQHELTCTTLVLQQKKLEIQEKQRIIKQLQQQVKAQGNKQVDLAAEASFGGKRKKTDSESNFQSTGQNRQEVPRRKMDDRRPLRRQSVAKGQITSSSIVQSVKVASSSHGEGRKSTRRTSIARNSGINTEEEPTDDCSKQEEDNSVSTDVDMIIPLCAVEAEAEVVAENETNNDDIVVSSSDPSNLYTEQEAYEEGRKCTRGKEMMEGSDMIEHVGQQSVAAARRSSLNRPLPLRRAVQKVASYREQPVNVKMRKQSKLLISEFGGCIIRIELNSLF